MACFCSPHCISVGLVQTALGRIVLVFMEVPPNVDEVGDGAGSEGEGSCGPPFACSVPVHMLGPGPGQPLYSDPLYSDPTYCRWARSRTFTQFPELSTLQQKLEI